MKRYIIALLLLFMYVQSGYSKGWSALGSGANWIVYSSTVYKGELVISGSFTSCGGNNVGYIAKWNGVNWDTISSGMDGAVYAVTVYQNNLIAGGAFTMAGGVSVNNIAQWDGTQWSEMSSGVDNIVWCLTVYNNNLIAGGYFTTADNKTVHNIAQWDGNAWKAMGQGMSGAEAQVMGLGVWNNKLIATGFFTGAGGINASHIAQWDGSTWDSLGSGLSGIGYSVGTYKGDLISGGLFSTAGGVICHGIAKWNGSTWDSLGSGIDGMFYQYIFSLKEYNGNLLAGGLYQTAGGVTCNGIARWNGKSWSSLDGGVYEGGANAYGVYTMSLYGRGVAIGGLFTTAGSVGADYIALWEDPIAPQHDAGVYNIVNPSSGICTGTSDVIFKLANYGTATLSKVSVNWELNGKIQPSKSINLQVLPDSFADFSFSYDFKDSGNMTIKAWTTLPNGVLDSVPDNDTGYISFIVYPLSVAKWTAHLGNNRLVNFQNQDIKLTSSYFWTFGDGKSSTEVNPAHSYSGDSVYPVSLKVTNEYGCANTYDSSIAAGGAGITVSTGYSDAFSVYPNPFSKTTTIQYKLLKKSFVRVFIVNGDGDLIATLVDVWQPEGSYSLVFDASRYKFATGIYHVNLKIDHESYVREILKIE